MSPPDTTDGAGSDGDPFADDRQREYPAAADVLAAIADEMAPIPFADLPALSNPDDATAGRAFALWSQLTPNRRRDFLAALQQLADEEATLDFERIQISALHDPDIATRILAIRGLWESERPEYAAVLLDIAGDDAEASVRAAAAAGLASFVVSNEFGMLPLELGERMLDTLRDRIEDVTEEDEVRGTALTALGASSEEWVAELIAEHYETGSTRMRLAAVAAMGRHGSDDWLPVLVQTFEDEDEDVRATAAISAGNLLLEAAVEPLTLLLEDEEEEVQVAAIRALGEIAGDRAEQILRDLLRSPEPHIAAAAERAAEEARMMSVDVDEESPLSWTDEP